MPYYSQRSDRARTSEEIHPHHRNKTNPHSSNATTFARGFSSLRDRPTGTTTATSVSGSGTSQKDAVPTSVKTDLTPGDLLRAARNRLEMTYAQASSYSGVSTTMLHHIENGGHNVGHSVKARVLTAFGVDLPSRKKCSTNREFAEDSPFRTFGEKLAARRVARNLSQADVAKMLGVTTPAVWNWEHDASKPSVSRLMSLARVLMVDPMEMIKGL